MQVYFTVNMERNLWMQTGIQLMESVCLIWGPLNTGFTVCRMEHFQNKLDGGQCFCHRAAVLYKMQSKETFQDT